jgi:hypothetical protein
MARLAIRATGDKSTRESVTTGKEQLQAHVYVGNKCMGTIEIRQHSDLYTYARWYSNTSKSTVIATWDGYSETQRMG